MAHFEDIFRAISEQGFDYTHPDLGWPGRAIDIAGLEVAETELIVASLGFEAAVTGGTIAAYPVDTPPAAHKPRLIETVTFAPVETWRPKSMTTIVGPQPPAHQWFGRYGKPVENRRAHHRVLHIASAVLAAGVEGSPG